MVEFSTRIINMSYRKNISAYTPSNTDPALLERIFVQRHRLLKKIVNRLSRSMTTGDKHHTLLIGPRGSGKTHLVTLVEHELSKCPELSEHMRIAWLGEDDIITGLIDIALGIADRLADEYPDEFAADYRTPVRSLSPDEAAESILNTLIERLGSRNIILIMENMDRIFGGLGEIGQSKWRAFLQEKGRIATLATSQQLFKGVSSRDEAFFGFFDIHHLKPMTVSDARDLIRKISAEQGNQDLVEYLNSSEGRFRIRAIHHLAGGNHRMYVLLSEFLTKESLDDLVVAFENLAEELTPYFQERVGSLPPQQARLVQCLCNADGAMTVKEIAEKTFIAERNCSKQLGILKRNAYVQSHKRGKESYYEMAEPLMRLCLEVKNQRGRPLKLVATFLRAWFPESKLVEEISPAVSGQSRVSEYCMKAMEMDTPFEKIVISELNEEIKNCINCGDFDKAHTLTGELRYVDPNSAIYIKAEVAFRKHDYNECIRLLSGIIDNVDTSVELKATAFVNRAITYGYQQNIEKAVKDNTAVIDMKDAPAGLKEQALFNRGICYLSKGVFKKSQIDFEAILVMLKIPEKIKTQALFSLPIPMVLTTGLNEMITALNSAFNNSDADSENYGGVPYDLLAMVLRRGHQEWTRYVEELVPLYVKYGMADKLGQGLTQTIKDLDVGDYSDVQLDIWNSAWQKAGASCEELDIPLRAMAIAIEVIKTKDDRPLFALPLEIRELVRPLLVESLTDNK